MTSSHSTRYSPVVVFDGATYLTSGIPAGDPLAAIDQAHDVYRTDPRYSQPLARHHAGELGYTVTELDPITVVVGIIIEDVDDQPLSMPVLVEHGGTAWRIASILGARHARELHERAHTTVPD